MNNGSALTGELMLIEENSDPIEIHPELNGASSSRLCGREHANAPIIR